MDESDNQNAIAGPSRMKFRVGGHNTLGLDGHHETEEAREARAELLRELEVSHLLSISSQAVIQPRG